MPHSTITLKSHAKINLYLDVINKRDDGYHEIDTLFAPIELHDLITLKRTESGIEVSSDDSALPGSKKNLAFRAADLFFYETGMTGGVSIGIEKKIPIAAGLGGGSSNAATTLNGLNTLYGEPLSKEKLFSLARALGADVPFFIDPRPVIAGGIGDVFSSYPVLPDMHLILINPGLQVTSAFAYQSLKLDDSIKIKPKEELHTINSIKDVADILRNSLEEPVIKKFPVIDEIKKALLKYGALGSLMSGSGPTVFGIYEDFNGAKEAIDSIKQKMRDFTSIITKVIP